MESKTLGSPPEPDAIDWEDVRQLAIRFERAAERLNDEARRALVRDRGENGYREVIAKVKVAERYEAAHRALLSAAILAGVSLGDAQADEVTDLDWVGEEDESER
jgi:hypothetical protein